MTTFLIPLTTILVRTHLLILMMILIWWQFQTHWRTTKDQATEIMQHFSNKEDFYYIYLFTKDVWNGFVLNISFTSNSWSQENLSPIGSYMYNVQRIEKSKCRWNIKSMNLLYVNYSLSTLHIKISTQSFFKSLEWIKSTKKIKMLL